MNPVNNDKFEEACTELRRLNPAISRLRSCDFMAIQLFNDACSATDRHQRSHFQHVIDFCLDLSIEGKQLGEDI